MFRPAKRPCDARIETSSVCAIETNRTALAVVAGMVFSLAVALLAEELIFGKVFCLFLLRRPIPIKEGKR